VDPKKKMEKFIVPSFHIVGKTDPFRPRSLKLFEVFSGKKEVCEHAAGHKFPHAKEKEIAVKLKQFLQSLTTKK